MLKSLVGRRSLMLYMPKVAKSLSKLLMVVVPHIHLTTMEKSLSLPVLLLYLILLVKPFYVTLKKRLLFLCLVL